MNSIDLFTYLVNKLDSHSRKIKNIKQIPIDVNTETFSLAENSRRNLITFYTELEEDLKQAAFAIKSLINELNCAFNNNKKEMEVLKQNQEYLIAENESLKLKLLPLTQINFNTNYNKMSNNRINDVKDIIHNMQQDKVIIKEAIKRHFNITEVKDDNNKIKTSKGYQSNKENRKMKLTKEKKPTKFFNNKAK